MRTRLAVTAVAVSILAASAAVAQAWKTYASKAGGFSVLMPGTPQYQKKPAPTAVGELMLHNFAVSTNRGATAYIVSYTDYPAAVASQTSPEKMLVGARDGQLKNLQATATSDKEITVSGHPGRDVQFKNARGFTGRCKMVMVKGKHRLYQVLALTTNGSASAGDFAKFVDSFKLTN